MVAVDKGEKSTAGVRRRTSSSSSVTISNADPHCYQNMSDTCRQRQRDEAARSIMQLVAGRFEKLECGEELFGVICFWASQPQSHGALYSTSIARIGCHSEVNRGGLFPTGYFLGGTNNWLLVVFPWRLSVDSRLWSFLPLLVKGRRFVAPREIFLMLNANH